MLIDASRIEGELFLGGKPPTGSHLCEAGFDVVVLAAEEYQPPDWKFPGVVVVRVPMRDVPVRLGRKQVRDVQAVADLVNHYLSKGRRVLVTCKAGLNRSALVAAATLLERPGATPLAVIQRIRKQRNPVALNNPAFIHAIVTELPRFPAMA